MCQFRSEFHQIVFLNNVQSTINHHWYRWWLGAEQESSHYLNRRWLSLLMSSLVQIMAWCRTGDKPLSGGLVYWSMYSSLYLNELMANILQLKYSNAFSWKEILIICFKCNSLFLRIHLISQPCCRLWLSTKLVTSHYLDWWQPTGNSLTSVHTRHPASMCLNNLTLIYGFHGTPGAPFTNMD